MRDPDGGERLVGQPPLLHLNPPWLSGPMIISMLIGSANGTNIGRTELESPDISRPKYINKRIIGIQTLHIRIGGFYINQAA